MFQRFQRLPTLCSHRNPGHGRGVVMPPTLAANHDRPSTQERRKGAHALQGSARHLRAQREWTADPGQLHTSNTLLRLRRRASSCWLWGDDGACPTQRGLLDPRLATKACRRSLALPPPCLWLGAHSCGPASWSSTPADRSARLARHVGTGRLCLGDCLDLRPRSPSLDVNGPLRGGGALPFVWTSYSSSLLALPFQSSVCVYTSIHSFDIE